MGLRTAIINHYKTPKDPRSLCEMFQSIGSDMRALISYQHRLTKEGKPIHVTPDRYQGHGNGPEFQMGIGMD